MELLFVYFLSDFDSVSQTEETNSITVEQKIKIREYVEQVVAEILGGNVDSMAAQRPSKDSNGKDIDQDSHNSIK